MNVTGRKVSRFRCYIDPILPPKPRNSFDLRELAGWVFEMTPAGMYVRCPVKAPEGQPQYEEHVVPYQNIQSIKLAPPTADEEADEKKPAKK